MTEPSHAALTADLEAALLRELQLRWEYENDSRFGDRMTSPVFTFTDSETKLGRWVPTTRRIEISRTLVLSRPWLEVQSILEHEMAHQFVDEVLQVKHEPPHGETFQRVCKERGIDARAAGIPEAADAPEGDKILERIRKLLALAGSANQHEAETAMKRAHELMLRHNVESVAATRQYQIRQLGNPEKRGNRVEASVASLLAELFFVNVISVPVYVPSQGKRGTVYEISGTRANVEMAEHVYGFLLATCDRLWTENRTDVRVRNGRDRQSYQAGVIGGFREKLLADRVTLKGTGLVWVGDADLERFYRSRHPRITTRKRMVRVDGAHAAGREAGRSVVLHKPVSNGPSGGGPKLLR